MATSCFPDPAETSSSCFRTSSFPWHKQSILAKTHRHTGGGGGGGGGAMYYTDADLAADMNALSVQERQQVHEEIHGVSDRIAESMAFIDTKVQEMKQQCIYDYSSAKGAGNHKTNIGRNAWDRAVFLRPALMSDRGHYLLFLRARRFDVDEATKLLFRYYETKKDLWGEDRLVHRVRWEDLTSHEQSIVRSGIFRIIPRVEQSGRVLGYHRIRYWDISNPHALLRAICYVYMELFQYHPENLKLGVVAVIDMRGTWKSPKAEVLSHMHSIAHVVQSLPFHLAASHLLYDEPDAHSFIQGFCAHFSRNIRVRHRIHTGSTMEMTYMLKTFGIDLSGYLTLETNMLDRGFAKYRQHHQELEDQLWHTEAPYGDPESLTALYPNPQDIIMGKSKKVSASWPGNILFNRLIKSQAYLYLRESERCVKSAITIETVHILQTEYRARFLARKDSCWEVVEDFEVRSKVSQALRDEARVLYLKQSKRK